MSSQPKSVRSAFELTGRNYIITGGAQGIGFTISRAICEMGGNVAIWDIQDKPVDEQEFESWSTTFGSKTLYVQTDVTKLQRKPGRTPKDEKALAKAEAELGPRADV